MCVCKENSKKIWKKIEKTNNTLGGVGFAWLVGWETLKDENLLRLSPEPKAMSKSELKEMELDRPSNDILYLPRSTLPSCSNSSNLGLNLTFYWDFIILRYSLNSLVWRCIFVFKEIWRSMFHEAFSNIGMDEVRMN